MIREAQNSDFDGLMELYTHLHEKDAPKRDGKINKLWEDILNDKNYHIIVAEENGEIVSSCTCVIIPNLTRGQRPCALVENVVTHEKYRRKGLASACLDRAREIALNENCCKIMLMTGAKDEGTLAFYEKAGYNSKDKTAFITRL